MPDPRHGDVCHLRVWWVLFSAISPCIPADRRMRASL